MMLKVFETGLQEKQVRHIVHCIQNGGIMIYPTDTIYGIGTGLSNIKSLERIAQISHRKKDDIQFTLLCSDLSHLSSYTKPIPNTLFRFMKSHVPGPFTFILEANGEVPRLFQSKKKQIGIRIPDNPILKSIIQALGEPLLNTSLPESHSQDSDQLTDPYYIHQQFGKQVDLVIDGGVGKIQYSTVLDCTSNEIQVLRQGIGEI